MQSKAISFEGATLDGFPKRDSEYTWLNQNNDDAKATAQFGYNINSQAAGVDFAILFILRITRKARGNIWVSFTTKVQMVKISPPFSKPSFCIPFQRVALDTPGHPCYIRCRQNRLAKLFRLANRHI